MSPGDPMEKKVTVLALELARTEQRLHSLRQTYADPIQVIRLAEFERDEAQKRLLSALDAAEAP